MEYNPFNCKNKLFTKDDVLTILRRLDCDYKISDSELFQTAMVHSSYVKRAEYTTPSGEKAVLAKKPNDCLDLFNDSYERLEHLGDSVIGSAVATYLIQRFPESQEGFLTNLRKEIVCNNMLGYLAKKIGLSEFYIISRHNEDVCDGRNNVKKLGDILEAFIGAMWIDCKYNFQIVYSLIKTLIESHIDIPSILLNDTNYKDQLQKYCQNVLHYTPTYSMLSTDGTTYRMATHDHFGTVIGIGEASTKKKGEQLAAKAALNKFNKK
jgi:ribonuclease-3